MKKNTYLCLVSLIIFVVSCFLIYNSTSLSDDTPTSKSSVINSYNNFLFIPKLDIKEVILPINHVGNNVEENVTVLKGSVFPNASSSILFLAAHSGDGRIAFFNEIHLLELDDIIEINYNGIRHFYYVVSNTVQPKDGDIEVNRIADHQVVLTTCNVANDKLQTVIVAIKN